MKVAILLLALLGVVCARDAAQLYKYTGRIRVGLPEISPQVSGVDIEADLFVVMKSPTVAVFKMKDIKMGSLNKDEDIQMRQKSQVQLSPVTGSAKDLEKPWTADLSQTTGSVMKIEGPELEYLTNIRKSISNTFRIQIDRAQKEGAYQMDEDTLVGDCQSLYTVTKLEESERVLMDAQLKGYRTDAPASGKRAVLGTEGQELFRLVRSIDFNRCADNVVLQHTGMGNGTKFGRGQFGVAQSRSSVLRAILRRSPNGRFRLERSVYEGSIIVNPFGFQTEKLQTISNQTLVFRGQQEIEINFNDKNAVQVNTWKYAVASPFSPGSGSSRRDWVNFRNNGSVESPYYSQLVMTGIIPGDAETKQYAQQFKTFIQEAAQGMKKLTEVPDTKSYLGTSAGNAAVNMQEAARFAQAIPRAQLQEVVDEIFKGSGEMAEIQKGLCIDALTVSGSGSSQRILLNMMKSGKISPTKSALIFMQLTTTIMQPGMIKEWIEFVKTDVFDVTKSPFLGGAALLNTAWACNHHCIRKERKNYTLPYQMLGNTECPREWPINNLLPFLKQKLESVKEDWQKMIYIRAIGNLGAEEILPVITDVISGKYGFQPQIRKTGMYALVRFNMEKPNQMRDKIFNILWPIIEDLGEEVSCRQAALSTLEQWGFTSDEFSRLAELSWSENYKNQMPAFITSTIKGIAQSTHTERHMLSQQRMASNALMRARPVSPYWQFSYNWIWNPSYTPMQISSKHIISWMRNAEPNSVAEEYYWQSSASFGGYLFRVIEADYMLMGLGSDEANKIKTTHAHDYDAMKSLSSVNSQTSMEGFLQFNILENIRTVLPLNKQALETSLQESKLLEQLSSASGKPMHATKFIDAAPNAVSMPTEIGFPVVIESHNLWMQYAEGEWKLTIPGKSNPTISDVLEAKVLNFTSNSQYKAVMKLGTFIKVLSPLNNQMLVGGVDSEKTITLPGRTDWSWNTEGGEKWLELRYNPDQTQKFPVLFHQTVPMTMIKKFDLGEDWTQIRDAKVCNVDKKKVPGVQSTVRINKSYTGIESYIQWEADAQYPLTRGNLYEYVSTPSKLWSLLSSYARMNRLWLMIQPQQKDFTARIHLGYTDSNKVQESSASGPIAATDSPAERASKIKKLSAKDGVPMKNVRANVEFVVPGQPRAFELDVIYGSPRPQGSSEKVKWTLAFLRSAIPEVSQTPYALCAECNADKPVITDVQSLKSLLQSTVRMSMESQIHSGKSCEDAKIADFKGMMAVSDTRKQTLVKELSSWSDTNTPNPTLRMPVDFVYDKAHLELNYQQNVPTTVQNVTYAVNDMLRGAVFPHIGFNYIPENKPPKGKFIVQAERPTRRVDAFVQGDGYYSRITGLKIPDWIEHFLNRIVPLSGLRF